MNPLVVISGCSGGGKSTLLAELARRGHSVVEEPGRRVVKEELENGGSAVPWVDGAAFARRAIAVAISDWDAASLSNGWVFFDRSLVDAAAALQRLTGEPAVGRFGQSHRYYQRVFLTPPWPEIYTTDLERRQTLDSGRPEYAHLLEVYPSLGYMVSVLPKTGVTERVDYIMATIECME